MHKHSTVGMTRRLALRVVPLAVAVALTLGAAVGPEAASARDNAGAGGASCVYAGVTYSHGSIVKFDNGYYYICNNGSWDFHSSTPRPLALQVRSIDLTPSMVPL